jgi:RNA polymerase sigma factor (sigma-70 family)
MAAMTSDAAAIQRSLTTPAAFAEIFDRHFDAIHAYLARRLGHHLADDLAGDVFRIAFEHRQQFDADVLDARPWLYGIATNLLRRHYRSENRRLRAYARAAESTDDPGDVFDRSDAQIDAVTVRPLLAHALASLEQHERDVLLLHAWEELSYTEIASALAIPIGTVRSRLSRGRARLRELLSPDGQSTIGNATSGSEDHG